MNDDGFANNDEDALNNDDDDGGTKHAESNNRIRNHFLN